MHGIRLDLEVFFQAGRPRLMQIMGAIFEPPRSKNGCIKDVTFHPTASASAGVLVTWELLGPRPQSKAKQKQTTYRSDCQSRGRFSVPLSWKKTFKSAPIHVAVPPNLIKSDFVYLCCHIGWHPLSRDALGLFRDNNREFAPILG